MKVRIKENSWLAKIAAKKLRTAKLAMVIGKTIHLHNTSRDEFISNKRWLCHELVHVKQYHEHGVIRFIAFYLWESVKRGYYNNRFEAEARSKEQDDSILLDFVVI